MVIGWLGFGFVVEWVLVWGAAVRLAGVSVFGVRFGQFGVVLFWVFYCCFSGGWLTGDCGCGMLFAAWI